MPSGVNGAGGANPYFQIAKQTTGLVENAGVDMSAVNSIITYAQSPDAAINGVVGGALDAMGASPVSRAVVEGAIDIVKAVLLNNYNMGADIKEAKQNGEEIANITDTANQMSEATEEASQELSDTLKSDTENMQSNIETQSQELVDNLEQNTETISQINEENTETAQKMQENNQQIQKNQEEIQQKQNEMQQLSQQIAAEKGSIPTNNGEQGDSSGTEFQRMSGGENNPTLQNLIDKYNGLAVDIAGLEVQNTELTNQNVTHQENIENNIETTQEQQTEQVEVTEEKSASIDEAATKIVSMCNSAEGAINEMKNMLAANFPKLDQLTLVKLATAMTKSAICGTNSGLLATAAGAMGVGSLFSFGTTAVKAAQLTSASVDQGAASAAHIAENVAGKMLQQISQNMMNQTLSTLGNITGVDINGIYSQMTQMISENSAMLAEAKNTASQTQIKNTEDLGIEGDKKEIPKEENQNA